MNNEIVKIEDFCNNTIITANIVCDENAIFAGVSGSDSDGYALTITPNDIKERTNRKRISNTVLNKCVDIFNKAGYPSTISNGVITLNIPSLTNHSDKIYTLKELQRLNIIYKEIDRLRHLNSVVSNTD